MMILEPFLSKLLSDVKWYLMSQYLWVILDACLSVAGHP